ncbi:MAG: hypothetical protein AB7G75_08790 [Candidatus Binatia bacterium]
MMHYFLLIEGETRSVIGTTTMENVAQALVRKADDVFGVAAWTPVGDASLAGFSAQSPDAKTTLALDPFPLASGARPTRKD